MNCTLDYTWEEAERGDTEDLFEVQLEIEFDYTPGDPGNIYGPPERCWPPEPAEVEVTEVNVLSIKRYDEAGNESELELTDEAKSYWETRFQEDIADSESFQEEMIEKGSDAEQDAEDYAAECRYDEMREEGLYY